jgi:hypothetical protein
MKKFDGLNKAACVDNPLGCMVFFISFHHPLPAFSLKFDHGTALCADEEVWVLLTRHLDSQVTDSKKFMSFQVVVDDQERKPRTQRNDDSLNHGLPPLTAVNIQQCPFRFSYNTTSPD